MITSTRSEKNKNRIKFKKKKTKNTSRPISTVELNENLRSFQEIGDQTRMEFLKRYWRLSATLGGDCDTDWWVMAGFNDHVKSQRKDGERKRERGERGESRTGKCSLDLPLEQAAGRVQQEQPVARQCVYRIRPRRPVINFSESTGQWSRARSRRRKDSNKRKYIKEKTKRKRKEKQGHHLLQ